MIAQKLDCLNNEIVIWFMTIFSDSNIFYAAVYAYKDYHDARLKVNGPNLESVQYDRGNSHIQAEDDV